MAEAIGVVSADGLRTTVQRRKRRLAAAPKPCLDYNANPASARLGELQCTVVLRPDPNSPPGFFRALCGGHNCHRHGIPSPCEMTVYNGPLTLDDVSPSWHKGVHMGNRDANYPVGPCLGMLIGPTRKDRFGATPADRAAGTDLGVVDVAVTGDDQVDEVGVGADDDEEASEMDEAEDPPEERHPYARLHAAAKSLIAMTDGNAADSKFVHEWFERGVEALRRRRELAAGPRPSGSMQEAQVSTDDSTTCTKLGSGRPGRRSGGGGGGHDPDDASPE